MLQVANGGYSIERIGGQIESNEYINDLNYIEPGYNTQEPAGWSTPYGDRIHVVFRKRILEKNLTGQVVVGTRAFGYAQIAVSSFLVRVKDALTGRELKYATDLTRDQWKSSQEILDYSGDTDVNDLVISIRPEDPQISLIDIYIMEYDTKESIQARIQIEQDSKPFAYLVVDNLRSPSVRQSIPNYGTKTSITLQKSGSYILFAPIVSFGESSKSIADFSYPPNQVFYKFDTSQINEGYSYEASLVTHKEILSNVTLSNVPGTDKCGLLRIDGFLKNAINNNSDLVYMDIDATGKITGSVHSFRVYFARNNSVFQI